VLVIRVLQALFIASIGLFALLVTFNNLTDYGSNFAFVQHVLVMDTTFPGNSAMYRALTDPRLHHLAYAGIIAGEALTGLLCMAGAFRLAGALRADADAFHAAKALAFAGLGVGFLLWFVGFLVVGGEWFLMWQSEQWNGQEAAFRFVACIGLVLLLLAHKE
jgi:predicted small integral membrane protein